MLTARLARLSSRFLHEMPMSSRCMWLVHPISGKNPINESATGRFGHVSRPLHSVLRDDEMNQYSLISVNYLGRGGAEVVPRVFMKVGCKSDEYKRTRFSYLYISSQLLMKHNPAFFFYSYFRFHL